MARGLGRFAVLAVVLVLRRVRLARPPRPAAPSGVERRRQLRRRRRLHGIEPGRLASGGRRHLARRERRDHRHDRRHGRLADRGQALRRRLHGRVVPLHRRVPDRPAGAGRADRGRRHQGHLRVRDRRGARIVSRHPRRSGPRDVPGAAETTGSRPVARRAAGPGEPAGAAGRRWPWAHWPTADARRHRVADCAARQHRQGRRVEHHRSGARRQHRARLPERRRRHPRRRGRRRLRRVRVDRALCRRGWRGAVPQGRLQEPALAGGAHRTPVEQVPDPGPDQLLLLLGAGDRRLQQGRLARHRLGPVPTTSGPTTPRRARSTSAARSTRGLSTSTDCSTPTTSPATAGRTS